MMDKIDESRLLTEQELLELFLNPVWRNVDVLQLMSSVAKAQAKKLVEWIESQYKLDNVQANVDLGEILSDGDILIDKEDWQSLRKEVD